MFRTFFAVLRRAGTPLAVVLLLSGLSLSLQAQARPGWKLIWSDEFNAPVNTPPDPAKWVHETGANGWGNHELEDYTNHIQNAYQDGHGHLVIQALRSPDGHITSARLKTEGKFSVLYGRVEARIQIPYGQGIWPAFWMLGDDIGKVGWPRCGEVDIMENIGKQPSTVHGSLHGPDWYDSTVAYTLPQGERFADQYHTFAVEWAPGKVTFFVDGHPYTTEVKAGAGWRFEHPFFLLLNLAVGGDWPGNPDASTRFPQMMKVDYVRVYQRAAAAQP